MMVRWTETNKKHRVLFISIINQLYTQNFFLQKVYFMPLHVSSTCAHHQEVKIAKFCFKVSSFHASTCFEQIFSSSGSQNCKMFCTVSLFHASTCFEHMFSKLVEAWNKLMVKQTFCASIWLVTEINILRWSVSKTSKQSYVNALQSLVNYTKNTKRWQTLI